MNAELLVATWSSANPEVPGSLLHSNEAWRHVMGPTNSPWGRLSDDDRARTRDALEEAARGALVTGLLVSAHTPSRDEPLPVLLNLVPVRTESSASAPPDIAAVTVTGEVLSEPASWVPSQTERHRMETLGRMTMGVAHDLNNLLSGILGHLELVREANVLHTLPADTRQSLNTVHRAAEDGAALIHKLQRYIRDDTEMHAEALDVAALIDECLTLTQPYWRNEPRRQGIVINVNRSYGDTPLITGVASELREVFVNLILNAVHAMPEGGTLNVSTHTTSSASASSETVVVKMEDTGVGMKDDVQARIFEPLFTTKGEEGTGLGLAASYSIVQEHNGSIRVDSTPNEGTTFTLRFPSADAEAPDLADEDTALTPTRSHSILVVDDEPMVRRTIEKLLAHRGHAVTCAPSGQEALSLIAEASFDIIFTDYGMPEMTGAELAEHVHHKQPHLPIVLLTGYTDTTPAVPHVDHIVDKPFTADDLQSAISSVLATAPPQNPS